MTCLIVEFKSTDSPVGITQETLQRMAKKLGMSEESIVHMALARFAKETLTTAYEADSGLLSAADIEAIKKQAEPLLPKGRVIKKRSLL